MFAPHMPTTGRRKRSVPAIGKVRSQQSASSMSRYPARLTRLGQRIGRQRRCGIVHVSDVIVTTLGRSDACYKFFKVSVWLSFRLVTPVRKAPFPATSLREFDTTERRF